MYYCFENFNLFGFIVKFVISIIPQDQCTFFLQRSGELNTARGECQQIFRAMQKQQRKRKITGVFHYPSINSKNNLAKAKRNFIMHKRVMDISLHNLFVTRDAFRVEPARQGYTWIIVPNTFAMPTFIFCFSRAVCNPELVANQCTVVAFFNIVFFGIRPK